MTMFLAVLATVGMAISTYFSCIAYQWVTPDTRWIPKICRMDKNTCASVVFTPTARIFGPQNSLLGQIYYSALLVAIALNALEHFHVWLLFLAVSVVTTAVALYLSYVLLIILRTSCLLCFTSHGINVAIFTLLLLSPQTD